MEQQAGNRSAKPWWKRKSAIAGISVGALLVAGGISNAVSPPSGAPPSPTTPGLALLSAGPTGAASPSASATTGPAESATQQPTATPTAEPVVTPTPAPTPSPLRAILKTAGRGDKVVKFAPQEGPTIARITAKGSGNFAVVSYEGSAYGDLLVNEIGSYSGWVYIAPAMNRLKITASGSWTLEIRPIGAARAWNGSTALTGKGDTVVLLSGAASGITTIKNRSSSNFAVIAYSTEGDYLDLLVNVIGAYSGEVLLPESDPMVLAIKDVGGTWSMSAVSQ